MPLHACTVKLINNLEETVAVVDFGLPDDPPPRKGKLYLYRISRTDPVLYDEAEAFVVAAFDVKSALGLCAGECGDEGPHVWHPDGASVEPLGEAFACDSPRVVLRDFNNG
jgi:hypothetical protein